MWERGVILAWTIALVIAFSNSTAYRQTHSPYTPDKAAAVQASKRVFGPRWKTAVCIAYAESRWELAARNGANLGPWEINVAAHPWASGYRLTHSWLYSARVAYRISWHPPKHGNPGYFDWAPWSTASSCGV